MKHYIINRFALASIIAFVFSLLITANAFAAVDMYLEIEGISGEGIYKAKIDPATGNVEIKNVPAGHYKTTLIIHHFGLEVQGSPDKAIDLTRSTIEISSFSWGVTNSSSIGSQSSGAGTGKVSMQDMSITSGNTKVSGYSLSSGGDRPSESISRTVPAPTSGGFTSPKTFSLRKAGGKQEEFYKVTFEEIIISGITVSGSALKTGYNVKANVKC